MHDLIYDVINTVFEIAILAKTNVCDRIVKTFNKKR